MKRTYCESTALSALPNSLGVSSGSGVKRAHDESVVTDEEEQPWTRARISALSAGLHGVDVAEDDEISSGHGIQDEWLSSEYFATHMGQKMVLEVKRKVCCSDCVSEDGGRRLPDAPITRQSEKLQTNVRQALAGSGCTKGTSQSPRWVISVSDSESGRHAQSFDGSVRDERHGPRCVLPQERHEYQSVCVSRWQWNGTGARENDWILRIASRVCSVQCSRTTANNGNSCLFSSLSAQEKVEDMMVKIASAEHPN